MNYIQNNWNLYYSVVGMRTEKIMSKINGEILIPKPESYSDCMELIKSDVYRQTGHFESTWKILKRFLWHNDNPVLFWFRLCQYRGVFFRLFCHIYLKVSRKVNIYLPPMTRIGYGLDIGHGICMVINGGTVIGNNVCLSHFLSIGTNHDTPAIIGDNVYIGPNSSVIEDVCIGSNVTIGAGSVVTKDIPTNATAVGSPAKVINYDKPALYIKNPYPINIS